MIRPVIDFHTHVLPGIDDGSASPEESLAMLRMEAEQGVRHLIATPHFYARYDSPEQFLKKRALAEARLQSEIARNKDLPQVSMGAEVYFFRGMSESEFLPQLTIKDKRCILIEMPPPPWSETMYGELAAIREKRGMIPIIAHIDRYISPFRTYQIPRRLSELPLVVQANAGFFLAKSTSAMALRMLKAGQIHLLGSDCHNMSSRQPNLGPAVELIRQKLGRDAITRIRSCESMLLDV